MSFISCRFVSIEMIVNNVWSVQTCCSLLFNIDCYHDLSSSWNVDAHFLSLLLLAKCLWNEIVYKQLDSQTNTPYLGFIVSVMMLYWQAHTFLYNGAKPLLWDNIFVVTENVIMVGQCAITFFVNVIEKSKCSVIFWINCDKD